MSSIKLPRPSFDVVPQMTRDAPYNVTVGWSHLQRHYQISVEDNHLDVDPDFQRPHVWTREKQIAFVEFALRGGHSGDQLYFNCPGWKTGGIDDYVLVDGKQRLHAALAFLNNEIPAFGYLYEEYDHPLRGLAGPRFTWNVNNLSTRAEVLQWYLDLNTGGVVHTVEEISKVQTMLRRETAATIEKVGHLPQTLYNQLVALPCDVRRGQDEAAYKRCVRLVKKGLAIQHGFAEFINFQPSPAGWRLLTGG